MKKTASILIVLFVVIWACKKADDNTNNAPTFTSVADTVATVGKVYTYNIITDDLDLEDLLTITAPTLPTWLSITDNGDGTATLTGTPTNAEVGNHNVLLNLNDGTVDVTQSFIITVKPLWDIIQISNIEVADIVVDNGNTKWIGTPSGLYYCVNETLLPANITIPDEIRSLLYEENTNTLWIGTTAGLSKATINGTNLSNFTTIAIENISNPAMRCAYIDPSLRKWFGADIGITMLEENIWKNDSFRINDLGRIFLMKPVENIEVNSIASWEGDYFFATSGGSLYRAKGYNDTVDAFTGATQWAVPYNGQNLTSNMYVVFVDSKGNQWMGGENGIQVHSGHDAIDGLSFTYYNSELAGNVIREIAEAADETIWVGTETGLSVFNGTNWTTITDELPNLYVTAVAFDKGNDVAWVGTKNGIVKIK